MKSVVASAINSTRYDSGRPIFVALLFYNPADLREAIAFFVYSCSPGSPQYWNTYTIIDHVDEFDSYNEDTKNVLLLLCHYYYDYRSNLMLDDVHRKPRP